MNHPNIILLSTDQLSWDALSSAGNRYVATPNIDRIRRHGVSFSRAYCTNPVCAPARSSWATGLYSSETGVPFNDALLHEDIPDIGQVLRNGGYRTYHAGKWHVDGRELSRGFQCLYFGKSNISAGGGEYYDGPTSRAVIDFLTSQSSPKPFYLQVGLINPHDICEFEHLQELNDVPDPLAQGLLKEEDLPPLPQNFVYDTSETMVQQVFRRNDNALIHQPILKQSHHWSPLQWRHLAWMAYRYAERVDVEIGNILAALEASGLAESTVLIFGSDHGEAAGRHKMFQKFTLYEESVRVPLTIANFSKKGQTSRRGESRNALVSGVDLFATICDYAGVIPPSQTHGRSLRSLVEGSDSVHRDYVFVENNYWERAIITDRYKLIVEYVPNSGEEPIPPSPETHAFGHTQLFDLVNDPEETTNIAAQKSMASVVEKLRRTLIAHEERLARRPLRSGKPRELANVFADALREGWQREKDSPVPRTP